jgi:hypothetical protein
MSISTGPSSMIEQIGKIIIAFQGIIGVFVGVLITQYVKSQGKVKLYTNVWSYKLYKSRTNSMGEYIEEDTQNLEDAKGAKYELEIVVVNQAEIKKHLRSIQIKMDSKGFSNFYTPYNSEAGKRVAAFYEYDHISYVNLPPHEVICLKLFGKIPKEDLEKVTGKAKIYLTWYEHNKQKKFKLDDISF